MNWRVLGALAFVVLALTGALVLSVQRNARALAERDTAVEALNRAVEDAKRTESIQGTARAEKRSESLKSAERQKKLQEAVERNKDWGSTVTPPEVQEALLGALEGLE